jgi:tRNA-Thr(GGU) m(6)t(6)A37 methyltransferase TsaA
MIAMEPIGYVRTSRAEADDDYWGGMEARIVLTDAFDEDALLGIEEFSHVEILFCFDKVDPETVVRGARHPRDNPDWPSVGVFAQRGRNRPNRLGCTIVRVLAHQARELRVAELDAIDNTPVLDIKPVLSEFLPREPVRQPEWSRALMRQYWARRS